MKTIVVGGGFGGLASAALLAKQGNEVLLIEKNTTLGGRGRTYTSSGFTFDMGPSWYLMPEVFDNLFAKLGFNREDFYRIRRIDPSFQIVSDGRKITVKPVMDQNKETFDSLEPDGYFKFQKYSEQCRELYNKTMSSLLYREFNGLKSMISPSVMKSAFGMKILSSMGKINEKSFISKEMQYITGFSAVFLGGDPSNIPAVYSMVNYSIFNQGVFYPEGGFGSVVNALVKAGEELGVHYITGEEITAMKLEGKRLVRVSSNSNEYRGDAFLFNADYRHVEQDLIPPGYRNYSSEYWDKKEVSPSALLAYVGISGKINLQHHTIVIDGGWDRHFKSITRKEESIPENFSFYVSLRSKSDPGVSPDGCENMFILIPVSVGFKDTEESRNKFINLAMKRLEKITGTGIIERILYKRSYCRTEFQVDYNSYLGSAFGLAQTLGQTAGMRPSMRNKKIENLFYAGQYTHPGIGVPMTIISAEIVSSIISGLSHFNALSLPDIHLAERS